MPHPDTPPPPSTPPSVAPGAAPSIGRTPDAAAADAAAADSSALDSGGATDAAASPRAAVPAPDAGSPGGDAPRAGSGGRDGHARQRRAFGALLGLAVGDAMGMPTQELSRGRAARVLGPGAGYRAAPEDNPISAGMPAGSTTDDTAQALVVARLLVAGGGRLDPHALAEALLGWEERMAASGSLDLLGPSTRAALAAVRKGADPATSGRAGTTNGAAMRIAPVGVATPLTDGDAFVAAVRDACRVTHDTPQAQAGAVAVAAVVSGGVDGLPFDVAADRAVELARRIAPRVDRGPGSRLGRVGIPSLLTAALAFGRDRRRPGWEDGAGHDEVLAEIEEAFGTTLATEQSVPAAFAVAALTPEDPWAVAWLAARLGGDADTIAAMATAMVTACTGPQALPPQAVSGLAIVGGDLAELDALAAGLLALRDRPAGTAGA